MIAFLHCRNLSVFYKKKGEDISGCREGLSHCTSITKFHSMYIRKYSMTLILKVTRSLSYCWMTFKADVQLPLVVELHNDLDTQQIKSHSRMETYLPPSKPIKACFPSSKPIKTCIPLSKPIEICLPLCKPIEICLPFNMQTH